MNTNFVRATAGLAALTAAGLAGAQIYSGYPTSTYGYGNTTGLVRCESINSDRNLCRVDTRGGVQLYRQLSRENCIRGRNWEVRADGILVDDGCRADFTVGAVGTVATVGTATSPYLGRHTRTYIGTDRLGRPIYADRYVTASGMVVDAFGNPVNDAPSRGTYTLDRYGNQVYVGNGGGYYATDRNGNRVYVEPIATTGSGYYTTDRYGNRVWVAGNTMANGYYTTDRYGNRVWVAGTTTANGYYTTDRYGRRVYVDPAVRDYDYDNDGYDDRYENDGRYEGYGAYGGTYTSPVTTGTSVIQCASSTLGRTYCGDRNTSYTLRTDNNASCILNQTYGRDSNGTWVAGGCSLRLEATGY